MLKEMGLFDKAFAANMASLALILLVVTSCLVFVYFSHKREKAILSDALTKEQSAKDEILALNEEIKKSEERMLSALEGSNDGVWDWNIKTNDYFINPEWEKKIGYKPGELKAKFSDYKRLIHREELPGVMEKIQRHLNGDSSSYSDEYRLYSKDGGLMWVETRGRVIGHDNEGRPAYFIGVHNDITLRKESEEKQRLAIENQREHFTRLDQQHRELQRAQRELQKAENKSRSVIEMAQDAIIVINPLAKIVVWNRGAQHMFGFSVEEMNWAPISKVIPDPKDTLLISLRNIDQGKTIELEAVHKDGHKFPIELSSNSWESSDGSNHSLIIRDLTERKRMESALLRQLETIETNQNFLNTVLDAQQQMTIVIKDKVIDKVNRSFLDFFDISELEEFTSQYNGISETFSSEAPETGGYLKYELGSLNWIENVLENPWEAHKVIIKKDRKAHIFTVNAVRLSGKDNNQIVTVFSDITELVESKKMMTDSIEYSSLIQKALIPGSELFQKYFDEFFTIWQPRDVVGGDIYFFEELRHEKECLMMVIDCTGHGVHGAFVTMLVKALERQIVNDIMLSDSEISPAHILSVFNRSIKTLLKQHNKNAISNAGFDGGVLYINYKEKIVKFAGSETPLFVVQDDQCSMIKGDRHSIGYISSDINYIFTDHTIPLGKETRMYLTTDGSFDQIGGKKGFRFGKKRFMKLIAENYKSHFNDQKELYLSELEKYRDKEMKNDDMTVIGIKL